MRYGTGESSDAERGVSSLREPGPTCGMNPGRQSGLSEYAGTTGQDRFYPRHGAGGKTPGAFGAGRHARDHFCSDHGSFGTEFVAERAVTHETLIPA